MDWEFIKSIAMTFGSIVAAVTISFMTFKKKMDEYVGSRKENVPKKVIKQSDADHKILTKMEQAKEVLGADRILVFDFHNGEHFANGRSALRMSATYEVTKYGIERKQGNLQKLPLSVLPNLIRELLSKGYFIVDDFEKYNYMQPEYSICGAFKMKTLYNYVLKDDMGAPVGFISIQFANVTKIKNTEVINKLVWFIEEEIEELVEK